MTVEINQPHVKDGKKFFINHNKGPKSQTWDLDTPHGYMVILNNFQTKSGFLQSLVVLHYGLSFSYSVSSNICFNFTLDDRERSFGDMLFIYLVMK